MFQLFKKKDLIEDKLYAPVIGQAILLENVPDNMFAQKILGDGVGFAFEGDTIYSPDKLSDHYQVLRHTVGCKP